VRAWSSGHHPQLPKPESWATASVYHFFYRLDRLLSEAVRRELFRHVELPLPSTLPTQKEEAKFASGVIDSSLVLHDKTQSLKKVLWEKFVRPIAAKAEGISKGIPFKGSTPRSAIFFGPPGTSKTELSKEIAKFLGWPFLPIDPSMLLRNGMDGIQAEANSIFRILEQTEGVVVLFDEFDELVQDRESDRSEQPSRLLTTAMLPKLASMHKRGTLVFIIATNNIGSFDLAIRRPGRFDRVLQIMPPTWEAKLAKKDWGATGDVDIKAVFKARNVSLDKDAKRQLGALTFSECNTFATELRTARTSTAVKSLLSEAWRGCTLNTKAGDNESWEAKCKSEEKFNT
jgi:SpoVK/Ycf46/Vps4 family AAA+-type ATPase